MKLIAHRGNINGSNPDLENSPLYIDNALKNGFDIEIDIRSHNNKLFLGHDKPVYPINKQWLLDRKDNLLVHCKDFESLSNLLGSDLNIFYHQNEDYALISNGLIWAHNLSQIDTNCIIPLLSELDLQNRPTIKVWGICSDYIGQLKNA